MSLTFTKNRIIKLFTLLLVLLFSNCINQTSNNKEDENVELTIKPAKVVLPLDSTMGFLSFSIQYYKSKENNEDFLCVGNHLTNSINIFKLGEKNQIYKTIILSKKGPDAVGTTPWAFYIHNLDSIFTLSHWEGLLSMVDDEGKVKYKYRLAKNTFDGDPHPWSSTDQPIIYNTISKTIYINGIVRIPLKDLSTMSSTIVHKLNTDQVDFTHPFPAVYKTGFWGSNNLMKVYCTPEISGSRLIHAFALDDSVRFENDAFAATSEFIQLPDPFADAYSQDLDMEQLQLYEISSSCYGPLITDTYRQLYYRLVQHTLSKDDLALGKKRANYSIIVLDKDFKNLGEFMLPDTLFSLMYFINADGLFFANDSSYKENEDFLTFDLFEFNKK